MLHEVAYLARQAEDEAEDKELKALLAEDEELRALLAEVRP